MPVPQIPTSISNMVDLITFLNDFYAGMQAGVNPPPIAGWEVVFTRKVIAGVAADPGYVSTGHTYDPAYEYLVGSGNKDAATPNPTAPTIVNDGTFETLPVMWERTCGTYKPDGASAVAMNWVRVATQTNMAAVPGGSIDLISEKVDGFATNAPIKIDNAGLFWTKWEGDAVADGHWVIARRRRYG
jgi:hypothetical protein